MSFVCCLLWSCDVWAPIQLSLVHPWQDPEQWPCTPLSLTEELEPPHQTLISVFFSLASHATLQLVSVCCCHFGFPAHKSPVLGLASELQPIATSVCMYVCVSGRGIVPCQYPAVSSLFSELQASCLSLCHSHSPLKTGHQYQDT